MSARFSDRLLSCLSDARAIVAFTGAGISAESGVPTFRGNQGIWKTFKPEELANLDAFMRNPALVWEWYAARKKIIAEIQPNAGHYALAEMQNFLPSVSVITQNIDNLHRRAGSSRVFELHGNIERNYCMRGNGYTNEEVLVQQSTPSCLACGGLIRPDVVWFGESLPVEEWEGAVTAAESSDILLSVGTSGVVYPAAELPLRAKRNDAYIVEINTERTELSEQMDEVIHGRAAEILPELCAALRLVRGNSH